MTAFRIHRVRAREVLDHRGAPAVEADVVLEGGAVGRAVAAEEGGLRPGRPVFRRDADPARFLGRGVQKAVKTVRMLIGPKIRGMDARHQAEIDQTLTAMDPAADLRNLGAGAARAVSLAVARAAARQARLPLFAYLGGPAARRLPLLAVALLAPPARSGGPAAVLRAALVVPVGAPSAAEAVRMVVETAWALEALLEARGPAVLLPGGEGYATAPDADAEAALALLADAAAKAGYEPGRDLRLAADLGASRLWADGTYRLPGGREAVSGEALAALVAGWAERLPLWGVLDPLAPDDAAGWRALAARLGGRVRLLATPVPPGGRSESQEAEAPCPAAAVLDPTAWGTLTAGLDAAKAVRRAGQAVAVAAGAGPPEETLPLDLAVAVGAEAVCLGPPTAGRATALLNRLLRIEAVLGRAACYGETT